MHPDGPGLHPSQEPPPVETNLEPLLNAKVETLRLTSVASHSGQTTSSSPPKTSSSNSLPQLLQLYSKIGKVFLRARFVDREYGGSREPSQAGR